MESDEIAVGSSVTVDYISENEDCHPDTTVHLKNFTGKLKIQNIKFNDSKDKSHHLENNNGIEKSQSNECGCKVKEEAKGETELHKMCSDPNVNVIDLDEYLKAHKDEAAVRDDRGRLPLHIFANNKSAVRSNEDKELRPFVNHLISAYSPSVSSQDDNGSLPFMTAIIDWVNECNLFGNDIQIRSNYGFSFLHRRDLTAPRQVTLDSHVQWSFEMLTTLLSKVSNPASRCRYSLCTLDHHEIIKKVSSIPLLIKTILYLEDEVARTDLIYLTIMQYCLLQRETVGPWLVGMLANGGPDASRAIDYFEFLSSASIMDSIDPRKIAHDRKITHQLKEDVIERIATLDGIFPSLLALNQEERSRALSTSVMQRILDRSVLNIALVSAIALELCLTSLLVMSLNVQFSAQMSPRHQVHSPTILIVWICSYFIIFEELHIFNKSVTWKDICKQYTTLKGLINLLSILGAGLLSIGLQFDRHKKMTLRLLYDILFLLIWLKLFLFMKKINKDLATFVHICGIIISESFWLLIIVFAMCVLFSDMTYILVSSSDATLCDGVEESQTDNLGDLCSSSNSRRFIRAYASLVGDLSIDDYRHHTALTILWILFTFMGVIVLLNVLIGIVNNVYSSTSMSQDTLIGNVWLPLLGRNEALSKNLKGLISRERNSGVIFHIKRISLILGFLIYVGIMYYGFIDALKSVMDTRSTSSHYLIPSMALFIVFMIGISFALAMRLYSIFEFPFIKKQIKNIDENRVLRWLHTLGKRAIAFLLGIRSEYEGIEYDQFYYFTKYISSRIELVREEIKDAKE